MTERRRFGYAAPLLLCAATLTACRQDMHDQPRYEPLQPSTLFADGRSSRPLVEGTVPRGGLKKDREYFTGRHGLAKPVSLIPTETQIAVSQRPGNQAPAAGNQPDQKTGTFTFDPDLVTEFPMPVTRAVLERGHQRFEMFCTPCHGYTGNANGMIVQRGLSRPPSFHIARLKQAPVGHFFDVITNGFGAMYSYASRVPVEDRWAIIAYIRALQLSQGAAVTDVPPDQRAGIPTPAAAAGTTPAPPPQAAAGGSR
jgi:hypothetical protein